MGTTTDRSARTSYRSVLVARPVRVLFGTVFLYVLGFQFEILGLAVLVYARTSSPLLSAVTFGVGFGPQVFGGALLTSLADRFSPHLVIAWGLVVRAAPGIAIGLAPGLPVAAMLVLVGVAATVAPVFTAASGGLLPQLLEGDRYVLGRSMLSMIGSGTQIVGLGLGGAVLAVVAAPDLLLVAGGSLLVAGVVAGSGLRHVGRLPASAEQLGVLRSSLRGNGELLADGRVRGLLLAQWVPAWFVTGAESLIVSYVGSRGEAATGAGVLLASLPVGMLVGALVLGRFCRPRTRERLALPLAIALGLPLLVFALGPTLPVAGALLVTSGLCCGYGTGIQRIFVDSLPEGRRGQAFGLASTGMMGGQGLSPPLAGALAVAVGVGGAMAACGALVVLSALALRHPLSPEPSAE
jgi:hypothetical protein